MLLIICHLSTGLLHQYSTDGTIHYQTRGCAENVWMEKWKWQLTQKCGKQCGLECSTGKCGKWQMKSCEGRAKNAKN